jgi:tetratricopeptide (TPR) repeat protein
MALACAPASLDDAIAYHEAGQLPEAEAIYRQILHSDPDELDALNLYGLLLQDCGKIAESIDLLTRAVTLDPTFAEALTNLARAQNAAGDAAGAAGNAQRAVGCDPDLAEAHLQLGRALLALGQDAAALETCRRAARLAPGQHDALLQLGVALSRSRDFAAAVEMFRAALRQNPDGVETGLAIGGALTELGRFDEAQAALAHAVALLPADVRGHAALANMFYRAENLPGAIESCSRALEIAPERPDLWGRKGEYHAATGRFEEAAACFRRQLAIDPSSAEAQHALARLNRLEGSTDELGDLQRLLNDPVRILGDRIAAGFALGTALDKAQQFDAAFAAFEIANRLVNTRRSAEAPYDPTAFATQIGGLIAAYDPAAFSATRGWGDPSEIPVFVVGMPRSGTTLVEQIAASHRRVHGAGERKDLLPIANRLTADGRGHRPAAWDKTAVRQSAQEHIVRLRTIGGDCARVIDKLPDNVLLLGLAAILFPNARVVICRRDPRDTALSCFFHHFGDDLPWSYDLSACGTRTRQIDRLVEHWLTTLPLRIHEVHYETLVADLEGESRRLLDFLGLEWDPACLEFHRTDRTILSASLWQVRQPLYATSVGRWRSYRQHLGPLIAALGPLLPQEEDTSPEADELFREGQRLLAEGNAVGAVDVLRAAVSLAPHAADMHHHLAMALMRRSDYAGATEVLRTAVALSPDSGELLAKLAWTLNLAGREDEALDYYWRAVTLAPRDPRVRLGFVMFHVNGHDTAAMMNVAREAVEAFPDDADLWMQLGHAQSMLGSFDDAAASYQRVLSIDPARQDAQASLVNIGKRAATLAAANESRSALRNPDRPAADRIAAGFALGAALDKAEAFDDAFEAVAEANRLSRAEAHASGQRFDPAAFQRTVDTLIKAYTHDVFLAMAGRGNPSDLPVFVVGLPRSGTTLVEQIAASHKRVFGAGELEDFGKLVTTLEAGQAQRPPTGWDQDLQQREIGVYLSKLHRLGREADRVVDKMPANLLHLGAIAMLLPNARIVVCERDLRDVALSCFMQNFSSGLAWTTDLADIAAYARASMRLLAHWKSVLPSRLMTVQYEALVREPEPESRRLIAFLGLEWDPACLDFHQTRRAVTTASLWQVRQPLYNTSVGRWRHYAKHLGPLLAGLSGLDLPAV